MAHEKAIASAFDSLWGKSLERNWILGRLGLPGGGSPVFDVPDKPGYKFVNKGAEGEQGQVTARDRVGVADRYNQRVRMRYEFGEYVIRDAEYLNVGSGGATSLLDLSDVDPTPSDGDVLEWDSGLAAAIWVAPGGGGGSTYFAGDAIDIDGGNIISVKVDSNSGIVVDGGSNTLLINVGDGIKIAVNELTLNLDADPGLEYDTGRVRVKDGNGIAVDSSGVILDLATDPGLEFATGKVRVKEYFGIERSSNGIGVRLKTTSGLVVDIGGLAVGAGDGIDVLTSSIAVDVTDFIDTTRGLYEPTTNDIGINLATNSGLTFSTGALTLGTPTTLTVATVTNTVTTTTHQHAVTTSSDVGTTPAAAILASNASGQLTLAQLTLKGNLVFAGGDRSITASNTLTLAPSTDLVLDPTGLVLAPNLQDIRTVTIHDLPTGIDGFRIWNRSDVSSIYTQLTIGAIKADELYVRVFTADETRIDRGEEYWSKSFGIVQEDFTLPSVNSTVDVWFEDAPAAVTFNLFALNDYLLMRTIDWGTGLVVQKIWWQVTATKLAQETSDPLVTGSIDRQKWRIKRLAGGVNGSKIKRGNLALDTGQVGQGWIHLSALSQDGGPFIQIGTMTSVSTVPQFSNYTRMGNLNGTVDYATNVYGFAAGDDLGTTPSGGFSGVTAEATNGLRLFNTDIKLYESGTLISRYFSDGLNFLGDAGELSSLGRWLMWVTDVANPTNQGMMWLGAYQSGGATVGRLAMTRSAFNGIDPPQLEFEVLDLVGGSNTSMIVYPDRVTVQDGGVVRHVLANNGRMGVGISAAASTLHVYENTSTTGAAAGVTIEQDSTGDALLQFLLTAGQRWVVGIDNSDSDKFKIGTAALGSGDRLTIDTSGNVGISTATPRSILDIAAGSLSFDSNGTANANIIIGNSSSTWLFRSRTDAIVLQAGLNDANPRTFHLRSGDTNYGLFMDATGKLSVGQSTTPASALHLYENTSATTTAAGMTIEQDGSGDAKLQFLLTGGQRWGIGIDNSTTNDYLVIAPGTDLGTTPYLAIGTSPFTGEIAIGIGTSTPGINLIGTQDSSAGPLLQITGTGPTLLLHGSSSATLQFIHTGATSGERSLAIGSNSGQTRFYVQSDSFSTSFIPIHIDHSNGYVGINESSASAQLDVGSEDDNVIRSSVYGATNWFNFVARRALTSKASPSAVQLNTIMGSWGALGYSSAGWPAVASAQMQFRAAENYTSTGRGSKIQFYVTPNGSTTVSNAMELANDGAMVVPYIWLTAVNGTAVQINSNGVLTKATSSIRYKRNVREMPSGFGDDFLMALKPIVYNNKFGDDANDYVGFVAEDVFGIGGKPFVSFNDAGLVESLHYDKLIVPTIAAVQDLIPYKRRIAQLEAEMAELRARVGAMEGE